MARKIMSKRVKMDVHSRDGWQCKKCGRRAHPGKGKNLHAHHIVAEMDGGQCEPDNMITLCAHCHQEWHFVESVTVIPFTDWLQAPPYLGRRSYAAILTLLHAFQDFRIVASNAGDQVIGVSTRIL